MGIPHYFAAVCYCRRHGKILSVTCTITFSFSRLFGETASHTLKLLGQSYKGRALFLYFNFYISVVFVFYWWQTKSLTTRGTKPYVARIVKRRTVTVSRLSDNVEFLFLFHAHTHTDTHTNPADIHTIPAAQSIAPATVLSQSSGAVWKSRWPSWALIPHKPMVSVDVKQHFIATVLSL